MKTMIDYDLGDILDLVGLTRKRSLFEVVLPAIGFLVAGAALGAGAGLAFAPSSGRLLRRELREGMGGKIEQMRARIQSQRTSNSTPAGTNAIAQHTS